MLNVLGNALLKWGSYNELLLLTENRRSHSTIGKSCLIVKTDEQRYMSGKLKDSLIWLSHALVELDMMWRWIKSVSRPVKADKKACKFILDNNNFVHRDKWSSWGVSISTRSTRSTNQNSQIDLGQYSIFE